MAMNIISTIDLDMTLSSSVIVNAMQYDKSGRIIKINLLNNGIEWAVPNTAYPIIRYFKSDRIGGFYDTDDNGSYAISYENDRKTIYITLAQQTLSTAGDVQMLVSFYNLSAEIVSTFAFTLRVKKAPDFIEDIYSYQYYNALSALIVDAIDEIEQMKYFIGAPRTAATVAAMTDNSVIYVYIGSESGYVNGDWYYWNGTAWTDGGVYNSIAFNTDDTLKISRAAADAKATGDAITSQSENIATVETTSTASRYYAVGDKFWLDGRLCEATSSIEIGDTIEVETNCKYIKLADQISWLINASYKSRAVRATFYSGSINGSTGAITSSSTRCVSVQIPIINDNEYVVVCPSGFKMYFYEYDSNQPVGTSQSHFVGKYLDGWQTGTTRIKTTVGHAIRIVIAYTDDATITADDLPNISITINACSADINRPVKIAMFGDSIMGGRVGGTNYPSGSRPFMTIPQMVSTKLGVEATNYGVGSQGWTTPSGAAALENVQSKELNNFDYVVLAYGINDTNSELGVYTDTTENTIMGAVYRVCDYLGTLKKPIILITPLLSISGGSFPDWGYEIVRGTNEKPWTLRDLTDQFVWFSEKYHIPVIRGDLAFNSFNIESMVGDNVHPTYYGYQIAGKYIADQIGKLI